MRKYFLTYLLIVGFIILFFRVINGQEIFISGIIRDVNTHKGIPGVNVFVEDTKHGTTSNFTGKYLLRLPKMPGSTKVVFHHVAYEIDEIFLDSLTTLQTVYLQPRIIPLQGVQIEEQVIRRYDIEKDIPQPISIIESKSFEMRGFVDAGDLLKTDHSIQVDEELSGKKTIAIRGGNPDEVIVMYNGVKMNSTYDNIFDFALIELEDVERIEIIRGSNTSLYGPEAFSGVINIVPRLQQDYRIRFQQRLGTYRSGNWGVHIYQEHKGFKGNFSFKRGAHKRSFLDSEENNDQLINNSEHLIGNFNFNISEPSSGGSTNSIGAMWIKSSLDYDNQRDFEKLSNKNHLYSINYRGNILFLNNLNISTSFRELEDDYLLTIDDNVFNRNIEDKAIFVRVEKLQSLGSIDLLFAYNYQDSKLTISNAQSLLIQPSVLSESSELSRQHHGLVSIIKFNLGSGSSGFIQKSDFDLSIRHDNVHDEQLNPIIGAENQTNNNSSVVGFFDKNEWQEKTVKFAMNFSGYREDLTVEN